jgi:hypothetical protein
MAWSPVASARLACAVGLLAAGCLGEPFVAAAPSVASPSAAATFIAAHAAGDLRPAERAASALHRAELLRRGRRPEELFDSFWAAAAPLLSFAPALTVSDGYGFVHALYVVRPRRSPSAGPVGVWRVDLDPAGRVVWGEPVRLLADTSATAVPAGFAPPSVVSALAVLPAPAGVRLGEPFGVHSATGDGYYGLTVERAGRPDAVAFFIVDEHGAIGPDRWSFGQPTPAGDPNDRDALTPPSSPHLSGLSSADGELLRAYLAATLPPITIVD